jgi:hypothetical protein
MVITMAGSLFLFTFVNTFNKKRVEYGVNMIWELCDYYKYKSFGSSPSYAFYQTKVQNKHKRKMAPIYTPVSAIVASKIKLKLKVRVVHIVFSYYA